MSFQEPVNAIGHDLHRHDYPPSLADLRADPLLAAAGDPANGIWRRYFGHHAT
jgi:hypothetical protein